MKLISRSTTALAGIALAALALAGCSSTDADTTTTPAAGGDDAGSATAYPLLLESPFGTTELGEKPTKVAVVSGVDLDIALALGVVPVISPKYGDYPLDPWSIDKAAELGTEIVTYDASDSTDFQAIAAAEPDVILATSGWTLDEDYAQLSKIAPVVSFQGDTGLWDMTWAERTEEIAEALDLDPQPVFDQVDAAFAEARAAHPEFEGATYTYAVLHPEQITYISYEGSDTTFFDRLGFTLPATASEFTEATASVSRENLDLLDADVLLIGYPFADEGIMTQTELESSPLFQQIPAVAGGHYAVVGDDIASPLAYPTPLSDLWVLNEIVPVLADAVAGSGA